MPGIQCINCNLRLTRIRRHLLSDESETIIRTIQMWTYPREITASDYICHSCWELATFANSTENIESRLIGHQHVCAVCGRSILRISRRRILIEGANEEQARMIEIISNWIQPRELTPEAEACVPCWLRAQRAQRRQPPQEENLPINSPELFSEIPALTCAVCGNIFDPLTIPPPYPNERQILENISQLLDGQPMPDRNEVCPTCWEYAEMHVNDDERQAITLPNIRRAPETTRHCIFRQCLSPQRRSVPENTRHLVLMNYQYYIPKGARICGLHSENIENFSNLYAAEHSLDTFNSRHVEDIIFILMEGQSNINYENIQNYPEHHVKYFIGLTKRQHDMILDETPSLKNMHRGSFALTVLLCKLRTGDSGDRLSCLFQVPRRTLETLMSAARSLLIRDYVPQHLGFHHITREQVAENNSYIADNIFGEPDEPLSSKPAITIADATYIYTQKSTNYLFQKDTYSLHKYRNLVKPFILCCCNGYIIDVVGPYSATTNDATIMREILQKNEFNNFFKENDIFILDRGFRDCMDNLHDRGYLGFMPETKEDGHSQLTTLEANRSRCVTINRWVVEGVNGRFKRDFKIFRHEYFNRACRHLMDDFKIAAALQNHFATMYRDSQNSREFVTIIFDRLFLVNAVARLVAERNLNRRGSLFVPIDGSTMPFPRLSMQDLTLFACGIYQIRQARSYVGEHFRFYGLYTLEICREQIDFVGENPMLFRAKIKSRHSSAKTYFVFIVVEREANGREAILSYCCNCIVGLRTVGCCSHVMSICWFLGYARHQGITQPAPFLDEVILRVT